VIWWIRLACVLAACALPVATYPAQPYPDKPIRMIVPFGAGGATDLIARAFGQYLEAQWKQPVVIENRPGANGLIGTEALKKARPDGYTLGMMSNSTHAAPPYLYRKLTYNPMEDFEHIGLFGLTGSVALVSAGGAFRSLSDLIGFARENPGKVFYGYGNTSSQVPAELLKVRAQMPMQGVQYKTMAQAMTDLIGGQIQFLFADYVTASGQIRGGKLVPIAVTESERCALWPHVPTISETYPGFELHSFIGLAAPRGSPPEVMLQINRAMQSALQEPAFRSYLVGMGMTPQAVTIEEYEDFLLGEDQRWKAYIEAAGIKPQ
jgi:tripartite-type tricarboxylate transporter receptor subunit TctC